MYIQKLIFLNLLLWYEYHKVLCYDNGTTQVRAVEPRHPKIVGIYYISLISNRNIYSKTWLKTWLRWVRTEDSKEGPRGRKSEKDKQYNSIIIGKKATQRFTKNKHKTCLNPNIAWVTRWYPSLNEYVVRTGHQIWKI
jgi:hypothetical protein